MFSHRWVAVRWRRSPSITSLPKRRRRLASSLRHATGYFLANAGQDTRAIQLYLGHRNIQHTVRYTELASGRFKDFWKD
jgi:site-specific recombinase XerD